ncbi:solute carrier family 2, facilitated glucose transporter member 11b [Gadus macrocephalus]|uniref:solute carrier family 2, facilitated glucose transporter member 11b n=1 Tax=Gadus macrocephalus TaxID=80720 RepID=UPI0028CB2897|nr:solute carrier family 2, facilitated glucose transporter member 11b [Gadus macrocephalus]
MDRAAKEVDENESLIRSPDGPEERLKFPNRSLVFAVCAACIGGTFQYGLNVSVINGPSQAVQTFINHTWLERYQATIPGHTLTLLWSTIVSIFTLGGLLGGCIGGTLSVKLGRKGSLLANNGFAIVAALLMGLSAPTGLFELLIVGRFLSGLNAGIALCVQPLYLGEIAPTALRGSISIGTVVFITGGILTGQLLGLKELLGDEGLWPLLLATTCLPALLQLVALPFCPESPRFLLMDRGDEAACEEALKRFNGLDHFEKEREDMESERILALGVQTLKPWELFKDRSLRWQLLTVFVINSAQQLNGINAIYFYADSVFRQCGIAADKIPYATVGTGACECITALTCGLLIDRLGRRVLIVGGYFLMSVCCVGFTLSLTYQDASTALPYVSMACIFAFILSFGLGPGGVTNILNTELFTQTTRPAAYIISGVVSWLSFFTVGMVFPFIVNGLQQYSFLVFLVVCIGAGAYILFVVPETKGKTFLEIHQEFQMGEEKEKPSPRLLYEHTGGETIASTAL